MSQVMDKMDKRQQTAIIAKNIAARLQKGWIVNLGYGIPTEVAHYVTAEQQIMFHGENGILGIGKTLSPEEAENINIISSSVEPTEPIKGASFFDSVVSFGMIRGGHLDAVILGTMEVEAEGSLANYAAPGRLTGMGGAMDLCVGTKNVIVATYHTQRGKPKIISKCTLPLTAKKVVTTIVTERAIIDVTENGLVLSAYNPMFTVDEIVDSTGAKLMIADDLAEMMS